MEHFWISVSDYGKKHFTVTFSIYMIKKWQDKRFKKSLFHTFHHLWTVKCFGTSSVGKCPFQSRSYMWDVWNPTGPKSQQAPSIFQSKKLTNNQKYWLTSFIWSKVNVQNNKKHGSERDIVQCKSTSLEVH